jgi:hypothetical protein
MEFEECLGGDDGFQDDASDIAMLDGFGESPSKAVSLGGKSPGEAASGWWPLRWSLRGQGAAALEAARLHFLRVGFVCRMCLG